MNEKINLNIIDDEIKSVQFISSINKNNNITNEILEIKLSKKTIKLIAMSECICAVTKFKFYDDIKNMKKKIISHIEKCSEIIKYEKDDGNIVSIPYNKNENKRTITTNYNINFKNSNYKFRFDLINESNGYYSGWLDIIYDNKKINKSI